MGKRICQFAMVMNPRTRRFRSALALHSRSRPNASTRLLGAVTSRPRRRVTRLWEKSWRLFGPSAARMESSALQGEMVLWSLGCFGKQYLDVMVAVVEFPPSVSTAFGWILLFYPDD